MPGGSRSYEMARRLVLAGHEVNLITSCRESKADRKWVVTEEAGIKVHWYPVPYSNNMGYVNRVIAFISFAFAAARKSTSLTSDIVFATSTPLTIILPGFFAAWRLRVPLVFEVRDMWPSVPIAMGYLNNFFLRIAALSLERFAYHYASHIVALAPGMRDDIIATGIESNKVSVIPNGCDTNIFGIDLASQVNLIRNANPWLGARKLVLFAGTFGRANGVGYLVKISALMKLIDPEIRFLVIGDGAEAKKIASEASQAGVLNATFFMKPAMPKNELAAWIAACNFTVGLFSGPRALWKDAVQNKFFDSLSAGKPIVCNFSGFQSELAVQKGVGIIVPADNPKEAAQLLWDKIHDAAWIAAASITAKNMAQQEFNRDYLAKKLESVLLSALDKGKNNKKGYKVD